MMKNALCGPSAAGSLRKLSVYMAMSLSAMLTFAAQAQTFPKGTVKLVVPGPAGSSLDNVARALAEYMSESWKGIPVIVENRPGASTTIGAAWVAKAAPDGHTLLMTPTTFVQTPHLYRNLSYHPINSFAPVVQLADSQLWLAVNAEVPAKSVREFVALAKSAPGKYSYASAGLGTTPHLYGYELGKRGKVDLLHIPYKGILPAVVDVAGGRVSSMFAPYSDLLPHAQANKLRILASSGSARSSLTPEVPTMKESGYEGFETTGFLGLFAPAGTPKAVVDEIAKTASAGVATSRIHNALTSYGYEAVSSSPQAFTSLVRSQLEIWKKVIVEAGVPVE